MRIATTDLDSLGYIVAYQQFTTLDNKGDEEKVKTHVRDFYYSILQAVEATHHCSFYQCKGHNNFRKDLYPNYKAHRGETPEFYTHWIPTITEVFEEIGAIPLKIIESDDALSILRHRYPNEELIFCHNDKDMFQIWGSHYKFGKNPQFLEITKKEALFNLYTQVLTGDYSTDNILGCGILVEKIWKSGPKKGETYYARQGVGPKEAIKLLEKVPTEELQHAAINIFKEHGLDYFAEEAMIKLLDNEQTYEEFEVEFLENKNLLTVGNLFESSKDAIDSLFDD